MRGNTIIGEKMIAQCDICHSIKYQLDGGKRDGWQPTFAVFPHLRKERCYPCTLKHGPMPV